MPKKVSEDPAVTCFYLTRRDVLKAGAVITVTAPMAGCLSGFKSLTVSPDPARPHLQYIVRRDSDELFLLLTAVGYREVRSLGFRWLERAKGFVDPRLIFTFPPQHFAETAIGVRLIPGVIKNADLETISLLPSEPSVVVFRTRQQRIGLTIPELLAWADFDLVLPDLDQAAQRYDLEVARSDDLKATTRIELPWGIDLTPIGKYGKRPSATGAAASIPPVQQFVWQHPISARRKGQWTELWATALRNADQPDEPNQFEVLSTRGFVRGVSNGDAAAGTLKIHYEKNASTTFPESPGKTAPLINLDRIEIAASLSRRFPYTGKPGPPQIETAMLLYDEPELNKTTCVNACYADGRTVTVEDFRLSSRGGSLALDTTWKAFPGCALTGWTHSASLGRDHHVKLVRAGFLYPFGTEAELVIISERAFVRDERGHFVAVLFKQAFIQVPQPNRVDVDHVESIFQTLSVTTQRTPPLDLPPGGDPASYASYDFFMPTVEGKPFEFEHTGVDWAGVHHGSRMAMFFVSNKARSADGLIWEPGHEVNTQQAAICGVTPEKDSDARHAIQRSGDGLRVVDKEWNSLPHRFAPYGDALVALAKPNVDGDTSQRVEWSEWVRGIVRFPPASQVAARPFQPRTRVVKFRMQGMSQFSGQRLMSLATYRDTRFTDLPLLDPEPTTPDTIYFSNLAQRAGDASTPYMFLLETRDLLSEPSGAPPLGIAAAAQKLKSIYFGTRDPAAIPDTLFVGVNNEVEFGRAASSDSSGGLAVPDTHVNALTRQFGPMGDATFNLKRWPGYANKKPQLEAVRRLDYAAFRLALRPLIDTVPFDSSRAPVDVENLATAAATLMGFNGAARPFVEAAASRPSPQIKLGEMFGADAQVLPGLSFADLFKEIPVTQSGGGTPTGSPAAEPMAWKFRVTGIDWLLNAIGNGSGQLSIAELLSLAQTEGQALDTSKPVPLGIEASLDWTNDAFSEKSFGPVVFKPIAGATRMEISARATMDLTAEGLPANLSELHLDPAKAQITSKASLLEFSILVFDAIELVFSEVSFTITPDGRKDFVTRIKDVQLVGALNFLNQLSNILGGLGSDLGIDIQVSPARVKIGQTLRFPPREGDPLLLGPAQITNLALSWGLMIPLIGRDVLTASFGLSSREKPMTIYVPPWYGGKAYILLEITTRGIRLLEISMEYGALIPVRWGIANGEASLTAGIFYMIERQPDPIGGRVVFKAFVKAAANVDVAGIIHFSGLVYISLSYVEEQDRQLIIGEAGVQVSVKIGFVRISYSFTATHVEEKRPSHASLPTMISAGSGCATSIARSPEGDTRLFGAAFDEARKSAFERIVDAYVA
jgi:hypothetical protein